MLFRKSIFLVPLLAISNLSFSAEHVILISVDGLRPDIINQLGKSELPAFYRFRENGVWTDNARSDFDYTRTLPNHSSIMTGRPVMGSAGHGQTSNDMPPAGMTLHNNTGEESYISSIFDVVHDRGLSTSLYVSKDKFVLFDRSYDSEYGAKDNIGEDQGTDKIDRYSYLDTDRQAGALISQFVADMQRNPSHLSFIHIVDTDSAGHGDNWTTPAYLEAVKRVDSYLHQVFELIDSSQALKGNTAIILTADHGGIGRAHGDAAEPLNHTIPFYAWGSGVTKGAELYQLNLDSRHNPGDGYPNYQEAKQPIRNGDAANLAMSLMELPAVPGSVINASQDLKTRE